MPARLRSWTLYRLMAALLLAVVGLHAAQPFEPSLRPVHGSAFSAATIDVALAPQRRSEPAKLLPAPQPALLPSAPPSLASVPQLEIQPALRPDPTGPPVSQPLTWQPPPRAPPIP